MFQTRNKLMLCIVFAFVFFLGNVENAKAAALCVPANPTVDIVQLSLSGVERSTLTYTLKVTNGDSAACADRAFALVLTGLPSAASCADYAWTWTLPASTGSLAPGAFTNINIDVASCRGPYTSADDFTFTITASQGGDSGSDSSIYDITGSSAEICTGGSDDDGDLLTDCADSDCLGDPDCCGNNIIEGTEGCDGTTGCTVDQICKGDCSICLNLAPDPSDTEPCDIRGKIGGLVPCGRVLNDPDTSWNETAPCNLCHIIPTIYNIINYLIGIVGIFTILFIVLGMLMSITSIGGSGGLATIKLVISKSVLGFVAVLVAWLIVNLVMTLFGFKDPMGDGSWKKISCNLVTTYCGDGIVNGTEVCEPGISAPLDCETDLGVGPAYCADIEVAGKRFCNCTCDGYKACTALDPTPVDSSSSACDTTNPVMDDYACCELVGCGVDGCGCCGRGGLGAPGGYTIVQAMAPCGDETDCLLSQNNTDPRNWMISTQHTTATFRCWK